MTRGKEVVIDYEFLWCRHNETVVKQLWVPSAAASKTFRFEEPLQDDASWVERERHKLNPWAYRI